MNEMHSAAKAVAGFSAALASVLRNTDLSYQAVFLAQLKAAVETVILSQPELTENDAEQLRAIYDHVDSSVKHGTS